MPDYLWIFVIYLGKYLGYLPLVIDTQVFDTTDSDSIYIQENIETLWFTTPCFLFWATWVTS